MTTETEHLRTHGKRDELVLARDLLNGAVGFEAFLVEAERVEIPWVFANKILIMIDQVRVCGDVGACGKMDSVGQGDRFEDFSSEECCDLALTSMFMRQYSRL